MRLLIPESIISKDKYLIRAKVSLNMTEFDILDPPEALGKNEVFKVCSAIKSLNMNLLKLKTSML